jgi:hypothetical protein
VNSTDNMKTLTTTTTAGTSTSDTSRRPATEVAGFDRLRTAGARLPCSPSQLQVKQRSLKRSDASRIHALLVAVTRKKESTRCAGWGLHHQQAFRNQSNRP